MKEKEIFKKLDVSNKDKEVWKLLSSDKNLSREARARSAYLYMFLAKREVVLDFKTPVNVGFYHGNMMESGNGMAKYYGLLNGINVSRFNQYKMTGTF